MLPGPVSRFPACPENGEPLRPAPAKSASNRLPDRGRRAQACSGRPADPDRDSRCEAGMIARHGPPRPGHDLIHSHTDNAPYARGPGLLKRGAVIGLTVERAAAEAAVARRRSCRGRGRGRHVRTAPPRGPRGVDRYRAGLYVPLSPGASGAFCEHAVATTRTGLSPARPPQPARHTLPSPCGLPCGVCRPLPPGDGGAAALLELPRASAGARCIPADLGRTSRRTGSRRAG